MQAEHMGGTVKTEKATFAMGCFWQPDDYFSRLEGVVKTTAGYCGGGKENPTYEQVCTGTTGHAEAVEIEYDPQKISYSKLLQHFFAQHDPTQLNRQGADIGTQYRSAVFYHDAKQKQLAKVWRDREQESLKSKVVTEIKPAGSFYQAEDYHQKYLQKHKFPD